ncbi:uncharacterized protein LOC117640350 isoform X2 [Thrips palmi]|uniref:Uncharacterized protein LOC117640350 isoform X2 n=1 Tax=Thrips palmi TaxID=161013 RepID=A0A6P8Y977_THRPL|nr:uncharacterized protein LOC117640350 isoform X2 [Thrips palmi]
MENNFVQATQAMSPRGPQPLPLPPPPVYLKPWRPRVPVTRPLQYLKVDALKSQVNASLDARVAPFVAQTSAPTVERSKAQVANASVLSAMKDALRQVMADVVQNAMPLVEQVIDQASVEAGKYLAEDDAKLTAEQSLSFVETSFRPKVMSVLDAAVASPKTNQLVQSSIEKAVEDALTDTQSEVVSTLSHWALHRTVETMLLTEVFPAMTRTVLDTFIQRAQKLVRVGGLVPAGTTDSRTVTRVTALEVAAETMQRCLRLGPPPVPVPVPVVPPPTPSTPLSSLAALPALPAASSPAPLLPSTVPQQAKKIAIPIRAPPPPFPFTRSRPGVLRPQCRPKPQLDALPDDVLLEVLRCVEPTEILQCALVNRRWFRLSRSDALWRRKEIRYDPSSRAAFAAVLRCAPALRMVDCEAMTATAGCGEHASSSSPGSMSDHDLLRLLHSPCRINGLRLPAALASAPSLVVSVLEKHKDTLAQLHLVSKPGQGDPCDLSALLHAVDHLPHLWKLTLAGPFNLEYTFGPRMMGAPRRKLLSLDLSQYSSTSPHTACSLIDAYSVTLCSVALPPSAGAKELGCLKACLKLSSLTAAADVLSQLSVLPPVSSLTVTAPRRSPLVGFGFGCLPEKAAAAGKLLHLTLDGVPVACDIPVVVRQAIGSVSILTLRRVDMEGHVRFVGQMPSLEHIVFDGVEDLSDKHLRQLAESKPHLRSLYVLRSLRCSEDVCWAPVARYMEAAWPRADIHLDLQCSCKTQ